MSGNLKRCALVNITVRQPARCRPRKRHVLGDEGKAVRRRGAPTVLLSKFHRHENAA
jgi:hypothetical protein